MAAVERTDLIEVDGAFVGLLEQLVEDRQLDRRGRRKYIVPQMVDALSGRQIDDGVAEDAVERRGNGVEATFEDVAELDQLRVLACRRGDGACHDRDECQDGQARHRCNPELRGGRVVIHAATALMR